MTSQEQVHGGEPATDRDGRRERLKRMFAADGGDDGAPAGHGPPAPEEADGGGWRDEPAHSSGGASAAGPRTAAGSWPQPAPDPAADGPGAWSTGRWVRRVPPGPVPLPDPPPLAGPGREPLVGSADELRGSWQQVQGVFVDDPHRAVHEARLLVERALEEIRSRLADGGPTPSGASSTEELRVALLRHRGVLHRVLDA